MPFLPANIVCVSNAKVLSKFILLDNQEIAYSTAHLVLPFPNSQTGTYFIYLH